MNWNRFAGGFAGDEVIVNLFAAVLRAFGPARIVASAALRRRRRVLLEMSSSSCQSRRSPRDRSALSQLAASFRRPKCQRGDGDGTALLRKSWWPRSSILTSSRIQPAYSPPAIREAGHRTICGVGLSSFTRSPPARVQALTDLCIVPNTLSYGHPSMHQWPSPITRKRSLLSPVWLQCPHCAFRGL
jgi:hypothetical protein